jgi:hypothetical protein
VLGFIVAVIASVLLLDVAEAVVGRNRTNARPGRSADAVEVRSHCTATVRAQELRENYYEGSHPYIESMIDLRLTATMKIDQHPARQTAAHSPRPQKSAAEGLTGEPRPDVMAGPGSPLRGV